MTTTTLVPLAPRIFDHQITSQYFLIPNRGLPTQDIVLTRKNPFSTGPAVGKTIHPIPFADREHIDKRTSPAHDFIFEHTQYRSVYDDPQASSKYTHMQDPFDTYDRDGILSSSLVAKGRYVDLYL